MIVKLLTRMAGPDGNHPAGDIIETENAQALIDGGYAVSMEPEQKIPKVAEPVEKKKKAVK